MLREEFKDIKNTVDQYMKYGLEVEAIKSNNGMIYSMQELKMIEEIKKEAEQYIKEKQEKEQKIKQLIPDKKTKKLFAGKKLKKK